MATKDKKAGKLSLGMKCGDCMHFKTGPKSPLFKSRCSELGVRAFARACQGYTPNFVMLNKREGGLNAAHRIAKLARSMNASQRRILGYTLTKMNSEFDRVGLRFGQEMYLFLEPTVGLGRSALERLKDDNFNYLDNWYQAFVVGITNLGDGVREVYLASALEGKPDYYVSVNIKEREKFKRALTSAEFEKLKEQLEAAGKKRMPKELRKRLEKLHEEKLPSYLDGEEQKTIDNVPYHWWTSSISADEKKAKRNKGVKLVVSKKKKFKAPDVEDELEIKLPAKKLKKKKGKGSIRITLT